MESIDRSIDWLLLLQSMGNEHVCIRHYIWDGHQFHAFRMHEEGNN